MGIIKAMKTVLITGGTRGIGLSIAQKYLDDGDSNVIVTGRKPDTLEELKQTVNNENFHTVIAKADMRQQLTKHVKKLMNNLDH